MFRIKLRVLGLLGAGLAFALFAVAAEGDKPAAGEKDKAKEEKKEPKAQATCPVMGGKIDKAIFSDHEGKRVYLCCKGCIAEFAKDPAKYIKKLEDEGVTLEKAPVKEEPAKKEPPKEGAKDAPAAKSAADAAGGCQDGAKAGGCCP